MSDIDLHYFFEAQRKPGCFSLRSHYTIKKKIMMSCEARPVFLILEKIRRNCPDSAKVYRRGRLYCRELSGTVSWQRQLYANVFNIMPTA